MDANGVEHGVSKKAAATAVLNTGFTRMALPAPSLVLPGVTLFLLDKMRLLPKGKWPMIGV